MLAFDGVDEKGPLVVLDPPLDAGDDLGAGHAARSDVERLAHGVDRRRQVAAIDGPVFVAGRLEKRSGRSLQHFPRFGVAAPAQMIEHAAADASDDERVGPSQEVEDDPPVVVHVVIVLATGINLKMPNLKLQKSFGVGI